MLAYFFGTQLVVLFYFFPVMFAYLLTDKRYLIN